MIIVIHLSIIIVVSTYLRTAVIIMTVKKTKQLALERRRALLQITTSDNKRTQSETKTDTNKASD